MNKRKLSTWLAILLTAVFVCAAWYHWQRTYQLSFTASGTKTNITAFMNKYDIKDDVVNDLYTISYDDFVTLVDHDNLKYPVIVMETDSIQCKVFFQNINNVKQEGLKYYLLEKDSLTEEQLTSLMKDYQITSVPALVAPKDGKISYVIADTITSEQVMEIARTIPC